jgi:hypothetical protein
MVLYKGGTNMPEMMSYIFSGIRNAENAIIKLNKTVTKQSKFNKVVITFGVFTVTYMIMVDAVITDHQKKLEALTKEIEELKDNKKGE